jgi:hypothetical protein
MLTDNRSHTSPDTIDKLLFIRSNFDLIWFNQSSESLIDFYYITWIIVRLNKNIYVIEMCIFICGVFAGWTTFPFAGCGVVAGLKL